MLNAPNGSPFASPQPTPREEARLNYFLIALVTGILSYTFVAGISLANGRIPVERAYLIMAPIPALLMIWHIFGFLRQNTVQRDAGLLISALGWALVVLTLLLKHFAVQSAINANLPVSQASDGALIWICTLLALLALGAGTFLSAQYWRTLKDTV